MCRLRRLGLALFPLALVPLACGDSDTSPIGPPQKAPLVFLSVVHPATVVSGAPSLLRAGVFVGTDRCWEIEAVHVEVRGNELHLVGTGVYRSSDGICPTALAYDSVDVLVPPLRPGSYVLCADSLSDTLEVAAVVGGIEERFAAEGTLSPPSTPGGCTAFVGSVLRRLEGAVLDAPPLSESRAVRLYGKLAGSTSCQGQPRHALRFRRLQPGVAPPWRRP